LAIDAKIRIQNARKERFAGSDAKRRRMLEDLEERERVLKKARMERREEEVKRWADVERVKDEGKKMMEEKEKEIRMREEEAERTRTQAEEEDTPPTIGAYSARHVNRILICSTGALDTTIRLKYTLTNHPTLTTPASLKALFSPFGQTDEALTFLSLKPPKKYPNKPAKYATAVVPFHKIGDAFAAVCASEREERGLKGIEIGWAGEKGKEPEIIGWLRRKGKLDTNREVKFESKSATPTTDGAEMKADTPQSKTRSPESSAYSSFPASFVRTIHSYRCP
jgi:DnaJ family protein C protein 17